MRIPNNVSTGEMAAVLRAKSQSDRFTTEEREIWVAAARMIEYLAAKKKA